MNSGVIDGSEAAEAQLLFAHLTRLEHLTRGLVVNAVINVVQPDDGQDISKRIFWSVG